MPTSRAVTVTDEATRLDAPETSSDPGQSFSVYVPTGGETVWIGGDDVTAANGTPVAAGQHYALDLGSTGLYGVVASGTQEVRVLEEFV